MTLIEFLLARLDEDEAGWELPSHSAWCESASCSCGVTQTRVLAECEAKRRIVKRYRWAADHPWRANDMELTAHWEADIATLHDLALIYADHPEFDPAWKVTP